MIRAWRLVRRAHCAAPYRAAFDGLGALRAGGRWNPVGVAAAYAASSRALSALEYLIRIDPRDPPDDLVFVEVSFSESDLEAADPPAGWREEGFGIGRGVRSLLAS